MMKKNDSISLHAIKSANPYADTSVLEEGIDQLVALCQLSRKGMIYGLTEDDVKIVEGKG